MIHLITGTILNLYSKLLVGWRIGDKIKSEAWFQFYRFPSISPKTSLSRNDRKAIRCRYSSVLSPSDCVTYFQLSTVPASQQRLDSSFFKTLHGRHLEFELTPTARQEAVTQDQDGLTTLFRSPWWCSLQWELLEGSLDHGYKVETLLGLHPRYLSCRGFRRVHLESS